jgi:hypothetical protein
MLVEISNAPNPASSRPVYHLNHVEGVAFDDDDDDELMMIMITTTAILLRK